MKTLLLSLLVLFSIYMGFAQHQPLDTLYANERQIVSLSFNDPIQKGITGTENFVFTFNHENSEKLGLLQAQEGPDSNLLVMTKDGHMYSFVLTYQDSLTQFHHFIDTSKNLINGIPKIKKQVKNNIVPNDYDKLCKQLLGQTKQFHQIQSKDGIRLKLTKSIYHNKEVYIVYELKNSSVIDYEINQLQLLKVLGTKKRKASYQELLIDPIHTFLMPKIITQGNTMRFILVYPKFTLGNNHNMKLVLTEKNGSRNFSF